MFFEYKRTTHTLPNLTLEYTHKSQVLTNLCNYMKEQLVAHNHNTYKKKNENDYIDE